MSSNDNIEFLSARRRYERALLEGSAGDADEVITAVLNLGTNPLAITEEVIIPVQIAIGEKWHRGEISVSEEHIATQRSIEQLNRLRGLIKRKPNLHKQVLIGAVSGDPHWIGARIVADYFYQDGWTVDFLGGAPPVEDLSEYVAKTTPDLIVLSVTIGTELPALERFVERLRKASPRSKIMIGGRAVMGSKKLPAGLAGVATTSDPREAVFIGRKLCGILKSDAALQQILLSTGERIKLRRKELSFSQKDLADRAGIDRAYVSAIESGKQNFTIGVLAKIAETLDLPVDELLRTSV